MDGYNERVHCKKQHASSIRTIPSYRRFESSNSMQYRTTLFNCIHVYLISEATDSKQYRPQNAYEVSNTNNFGSVSNSLERLAAESGCMSSKLASGYISFSANKQRRQSSME